MAAEPLLAVIIPAFNEEATIEAVLRQVDALECVREIIVVDDGSHDHTANLVKSFPSPRVRLLQQKSNKGKTAAVRRGIAEVTSPIVIIQDADAEYDPREIPDIIAPIVEGKADVVYGSRFLVRQAARILYFYHYLANQALTFMSDLFTNLNLSDIETGYKAFRTPILQLMPLTSRGFGLEVEITALVAKTRARVFEVPISYCARTYEEGKKISFKDGLYALWYILYFHLTAAFSQRHVAYVKTINAWLQAESVQPPFPVISSEGQQNRWAITPGQEDELIIQ